MDWLKRQLYRLKVVACVIFFVIGLVVFLVGFALKDLGEWIMTKGVVHCPDMIARFGR